MHTGKPGRKGKAGGDLIADNAAAILASAQIKENAIADLLHLGPCLEYNNSLNHQGRPVKSTKWQLASSDCAKAGLLCLPYHLGCSQRPHSRLQPFTLADAITHFVSHLCMDCGSDLLSTPRATCVKATPMWFSLMEPSSLCAGTHLAVAHPTS